MQKIWQIKKKYLPLHSQEPKRGQHLVPWPSGEATVCKTVYSSSILLGTSLIKSSIVNETLKLYCSFNIFDDC